MGLAEAIFKAIERFLSDVVLRKFHHGEKLREHDTERLLEARDVAGWIKEQLLDAREFGLNHERITKRIEELQDLQGHLAHLFRIQNALLIFRRSAIRVLSLSKEGADRDKMDAPSRRLELDYNALLEELKAELR